MGNFSIGVNGGYVTVSLNENLPEQDVQQMLTFRPEDVEEMLQTHAGIQAYWEALAIRLKSRYEGFKENWSRKWWAHSNSYARALLSSYGDNKPTASVIQDTAIQIYTADASDNERMKFCTAAFNLASRKGYKGSAEEYYADMYKYLLGESAWYFETVVDTLRRLQEEFEIVHKVADRLNSQSFHLDLYAKMQMAKKGNIGPMALDEAALMRQMGGSS